MNSDNEVRLMWASALIDAGKVDDGRAMKWLERVADAGQPEASKKIGDLYLWGLGVGKDLSRAFAWFKKASDGGCASGQSRIGDCYRYGWGTDKSLSSAVEWYSKAAEQDDVDAMCELADILISDEGDVGKDEDRGVKLLQTAANRGQEKAQWMLGCLFINPGARNVSSIAQDVGEGVKWLQKSAEQSFGMAECTLAAFYVQGIGVEKDLVKAKELYERALKHGGLLKGMEDDAREVLGKLNSTLNASSALLATQEEKFQSYMSTANAGDVDAMVEVAHCYQIGYGCEKSNEEALSWNRKAAELGNPEAQLQMGIAYVCADGVEQDLKKAFDWYMKSAMQGNANAQNYVGGAYADGDGVDVDKEAAVEWLWKAAEQNQTAAIRKLRKLGGRGLDEFLKCLDPDADDMKWWKFQKIVSDAQRGDVQAIYDLGDALFCGKCGAIENERASIKWYKMAAEKGHVIAQKELGDIYSSDNTIEMDNNEALKWYRMAAEQGDGTAQYWCGDLLEHGDGVDHDIEEAKRWYRKAADNGDDDAKEALERLG